MRILKQVTVLNKKNMVISKQNGKNYSVYYENTAAAFAYAADILNGYIQKATGFALGDRETAKNFIVIGECSKSKAVISRYDLSALGDDGFYIAFEDGNIYIFGNTPVSCVYGVYEFLERYLGVRFLNVDCDYIPQTESIVILEETVKRVPLFAERMFYCPAGFYEDYAEFAHKLRFSGDFLHYHERYGTVKRWFNDVPNSPHNSVSYVPKAKYGATHPEFYCKSSFDEELCYSNGITDEGELDTSMQESVALAVADSLEGYIKQAKTEKYFMFGKPDDRNALCHCARCDKRRAKYGGEAGLILVFLNAVIKEVENRLKSQNIQSDFQVVTFAYQSTVNPPVDENYAPVDKKVIPVSRLHIRYAPISADYTYSFLDERQKEDVSTQIKGWTRLTHNIMIWDYMSNFGEYSWYMPNLPYFKENLRLYAENRFSYVFNQGAYNVRREWQAEMKAYISSKLYWDLDLSVEDLQKEYVTLYYGPASKTVLAFLQTMEAFFKERIEKGLHISLGTDEKFVGHENCPVEFLLSVYRALQDGFVEIEKSSISEREKEAYIFRLEMVTLTPLRMMLANKHDYKGFAYEDLEKEFYRIMKKANIEKLAETLPLYIEIGNGGQSEYKIVTTKTPTAEEKASAEYLQNYLQTNYGFTVPIVDDDWNNVWPSSRSKGFLIGVNGVSREFFKDGIDLSDKEYWLQSIGRCFFIMSGTDILGATKYFAENIVKREGDKVFTHIFCEVKRIDE